MQLFEVQTDPSPSLSTTDLSAGKERGRRYGRTIKTGNLVFAEAPFLTIFKNPNFGLFLLPPMELIQY